jgi:long-subunit acyl-CoA synthetase (AMP-forming)
VGDVLLSILPCWHIFERAAEYCFLARGATLTYSSIKTLKADLEVSDITNLVMGGGVTGILMLLRYVCSVLI